MRYLFAALALLAVTGCSTTGTTNNADWNGVGDALMGHADFMQRQQAIRQSNRTYVAPMRTTDCYRVGNRVMCDSF